MKIMKKYCLLFFLIHACDLTAQVSKLPIENPMLLWYNRPAVIPSKNLKNTTLIGYVDGDKNVKVSFLKNFSKIDTTLCLYTYAEPTSDDHGSPALLELKNKIVAFCSWHTSDLYQLNYYMDRKKVETVQIDSFCTYQQVYRFSSGRIALLYNKAIVDSLGHSLKRNLSLRYSDDNCSTWSDEVVVVESKENELPYFIANVKRNKIVIAYAVYNQDVTGGGGQHKNLYILESNDKLTKWKNSKMKPLTLPVTENEPAYISPDSLDVNVFDIKIGREIHVLFTMFEPYYSASRFQNAKLYLYKSGKVHLVGNNAAVLYSSGGAFYGSKIYNVNGNTIELFSLKTRKKLKEYRLDVPSIRELRIVKGGIFAVSVTDSLYMAQPEGKRWRTELLFVK